MAVSMRVSNVVAKLKNDPRTRRLDTLFNEHPIYKISVETYQQEIAGSHASRTARRLSPKEGKFIDSLIRALTIEVTTRSRLSEINIECAKCISSLEKALAALKDHLLIAYADDLRSFSTKEERSRVIQIALRKYTRYLDDVKSLQECTLIVITDIDKACWNLKVIAELLKPSSGGREFTV